MKLLRKLIALRPILLEQFSGPQKPIVLVLLIAEFIFALILITQDCSQALVAHIVTWMGILALAALCLFYLIYEAAHRAPVDKRPDNNEVYDIKGVDEFNKKARGLSLERENGVISIPSRPEPRTPRDENSPPVSGTPRNEPDDE